MLTMYLYTFAQQENCLSTLHLKILDASSGIGIEDVTAYIPQQQKGNHSNQTGELSIEKLCTGEYTLICKHLNHEEKKEKINIKAGDNTKIIYMTCHTDTLHNVTIKGARLHWEETQVIHRIQDKDLFLSQGLSLGKALEKVNGVYNLSTGNNISKPILRGLHSNRVLILNNEIRQEGQQWGNEHAPEIDQFMAKRIEVVKGAQTIKYGSDVIGGIILVTPNPLQEIDGVGAEINTGFISNGRATATSLLLEGRKDSWKGFAWRIQGTLKRSGNTHTPDYFLKNTGMKEMNYSGAIGYQHKKINVELFHSYFNTELAIFAGSHIGNLTDLYNAFNATRPIDSSGFTYKIDMPYQHVLHQLTKVSTSYQVNRIGLLKFIAGYQQNIRKEFDRNIVALQPDGSYKPSLHFVLKTQYYNLSVAHIPIKKWTGESGMNAVLQTNEYFGSYFIPNYQKNAGGIYFTEKWHQHAFSAEGGIRFDVNQLAIQKWENNILLHRTHSFAGLAASTALRYQLPFFTFHVNAGTSWRAPFVNELYSYGVHHSAASFEMGDSLLVQERSYNTSLTIDFNHKNNFQAKLTVYNNYIKNFINMQPVLPATLTIRGAFPTFQYLQTDVNMFGIEWSATTAITPKLQWHCKGNVLYAKDITQDAYLFGMPPARFESDLDYTLFQKAQNNIHFMVNASYTMKQQLVDQQLDYVPPPDAYFLLHSEWVADWLIAKQIMHFNIGVNNILNTRYRDYLNRNRYFANENGRNFYFRCSIPLFISSNKKLETNKN